MRFALALVAALILVAAAFAAVFGAGWAVVHLAGPTVFAWLPAPIAYLVTAAVAAGVVYAVFVALPGRRKKPSAPRETSRI